MFAEEHQPDRRAGRGLPELGDRQRDILRAVIREHLATAQPVGSGALVSRYRMNVSSATVRNELAVLETLGLLTHPHTSAGRVPTDLGYRYFIESLMPQPALGPDEEVTVRHQFRQAQRDTAEWVRLAASTLARLTREAAIVTAPAPTAERPAIGPGDVHYEGIQNILAQPEFAKSERFGELLRLLEDRTQLVRLVPPGLGEGEVHVAIGSEHPLEPLRRCSLIFGRYGGPAGVVGYIGVVGPTRMDYARSIGAVLCVGGLMDDLVRAAGVRG